MKKWLFALLLLPCIAIATACMELTLEGSGSPKPIYHVETIHTSYYGFTWSHFDSKKATDGIGLYRVVYHTNYLYSLIGVLTLGLYEPIQVQWWLQQPPDTHEKVIPDSSLMKSSRKK